MTNGKKREENGVTLLELLVALVVLIILATAAVSLLNPFKRQIKTDDAAGVLFTLMRQGRLQAITRRQFYAVVVNTATSEQVYQLNNSTKNLTFQARSVSLVDMGRSAVQNDEEISLAKKIPREVLVNSSTGLPVASTTFPLPERNFTAHNFATSTPANLYTCYFDPAGRAVNAADGTGTLEYKIFYFSAPDITLTKSAPLLRSITVYGATGGLKFWRYDLGQAKWISQIG